MSMESLEAMRLFLVVIKAGSLSAAARQTGQSPASVSRKIARLEASVGAKLIDRSSRNLAVTTIGDLYHEKVSRIIGQIDDLSATISEQQTVPRGILRFNTNSVIFDRFLSGTIPEFLALYPEIMMELELSDDVPDPNDTAIHVDLRIGMPNDQGLVIRRLSQGAERVLCASPTYLQNHPQISQVQDLATHNFVTVRKPGRERTVLYCRSAAGMKELTISGSLTVSDASVLREAVCSGVGLGLLPAWVIAEDLDAGLVTRILPNVEMTHGGFDHGIFAVFRRTDQSLPKVRVFVDFLVETFRRRDEEISRVAMSTRQQSLEHGMRAPDAMRWITPSGISRR